jgi:hypothetical protein
LLPSIRKIPLRHKYIITLDNKARDVNKIDIFKRFKTLTGFKNIRIRNVIKIEILNITKGTGRPQEKDSYIITESD